MSGIELSLDEWCDKLVHGTRARKELDSLRTRLAEAEEERDALKSLAEDENRIGAHWKGKYQRMVGRVSEVEKSAEDRKLYIEILEERKIELDLKVMEVEKRAEAAEAVVKVALECSDDGACIHGETGPCVLYEALDDYRKSQKDYR